MADFDNFGGSGYIGDLRYCLGLEGFGSFGGFAGDFADLADNIADLEGNIAGYRDSLRDWGCWAEDGLGGCCRIFDSRRLTFLD